VAAIQCAPHRSEMFERTPAKRRSFFADRSRARPGTAVQRTPALTARARALSVEFFRHEKKTGITSDRFRLLISSVVLKIKFKKLLQNNSLISTLLEKTKKSFHVYYVSVSPF